MSAINYTLIGAYACIIAVCIYLLTGTRLVKFIQFFAIKQQYKNLKISIDQQPQLQQNSQEDH